MVAETFMELVRDPNHWAFEIMLMIIFDVLIGMIAWPFAKKWLVNHDAKKHGHQHCEDVHQEPKKPTNHDDIKHVHLIESGYVGPVGFEHNH